MIAWLHEGMLRAPGACRRHKLTAGLAGLTLGLLACGAPAEAPATDTARLKQETCLAIAQEYADALPDALLCDPASASDSCAARRPVVIYETNYGAAGAPTTLTGLSACAAPVNAARTATLDEVLQRYTAAGCKLQPTPCVWNQGSPETEAAPPCRLRSDGVGSCNG